MLNTLRKKSTKQKFYSTVALVLSLVCTLLFVNAGEPTPQTSNNKFSFLKPHEPGDREPANFNKTRSPLSTTVIRIDDGLDSSMIRLQGTVKARHEFKNLKVVWTLPADVKIVSGPAEVMTTLESGESQNFEILISSNSGQNRQVYFNAQTTDRSEGDNYGSSAQYNTTQQEAIAKQTKENFLKTRMKVRAGELRKIMF